MAALLVIYSRFSPLRPIDAYLMGGGGKKFQQLAQMAMHSGHRCVQKFQYLKYRHWHLKNWPQMQGRRGRYELKSEATTQKCVNLAAMESGHFLVTTVQ